MIFKGFITEPVLGYSSMSFPFIPAKFEAVYPLFAEQNSPQGSSLLTIPEEMLYVLMIIVAFIVTWLDRDTSSDKDGVTRQSIAVEEPKKVFHLIRDFNIPDSLKTFVSSVGLEFGTNVLVGTSSSKNPTTS